MYCQVNLCLTREKSNLIISREVQILAISNVTSDNAIILADTHVLRLLNYNVFREKRISTAIKVTAVVPLVSLLYFAYSYSFLAHVRKFAVLCTLMRVYFIFMHIYTHTGIYVDVFEMCLLNA